MMLSVEAIEAGYHGAKVLQGVDFDLDEGEASRFWGATAWARRRQCGRCLACCR